MKRTGINKNKKIAKSFRKSLVDVFTIKSIKQKTESLLHMIPKCHEAA